VSLEILKKLFLCGMSSVGQAY